MLHHPALCSVERIILIQTSRSIQRSGKRSNTSRTCLPSLKTGITLAKAGSLANSSGSAFHTSELRETAFSMKSRLPNRFAGKSLVVKLSLSTIAASATSSSFYHSEDRTCHSSASLPWLKTCKNPYFADVTILFNSSSSVANSEASEIPASFMRRFLFLVPIFVCSCKTDIVWRNSDRPYQPLPLVNGASDAPHRGFLAYQTLVKYCSGVVFIENW